MVARQWLRWGWEEGSLCTESPSPQKKKNWRREERRASVRGPEGWGLEIKVIHFYNMNYVAHICIFLKKCSFHVEQL